MSEDIFVSLFLVTCALAIVIGATWLLFRRLRRREPIGRSFGQWIKHLLEAVLGL